MARVKKLLKLENKTFVLGESVRLIKLLSNDKMSTQILLDSCRKIYVERDYSDGSGVAFHREMPMQLEGIVSEFELISAPFKLQLKRFLDRLQNIRRNDIFDKCIVWRSWRSLLRFHAGDGDKLRNMLC